MKDTLPAAVAYDDDEALARLDDLSLLLLTDECEVWSSWMDGLRAGLTTDAGRTEWSVQMKGEINDVDAAYRRVRNEIEGRRARDIEGRANVRPRDREKPPSPWGGTRKRRSSA